MPLISAEFTSILVCSLALVTGACAVAEDAAPESSSVGGSGGSAGSAGASGAGAVGGTGGTSWSSGGSSGSGGSAGSAGGAGSWGSGGSAGGAGAGGTAGTGGSPGGAELLCDGLDNDQNGIIDDVDKGKDGICDCLKIATLGIKGKWGQGNVFATWLDARSDFGADDLALQVLTPALIAPYDIIVAQDVSTKGGFQAQIGLEPHYAAPEVAALQSWITAGGGFMTMAGYEDEWSVKGANELLAPLGMYYGDYKVLGNGAGGSIPISTWNPHAITTGISLVGVNNGYPVLGAGTVLASQNNTTVLRANTAGTGRVVMWADEWITYDSEWLANPQYQVELFWLNLIKWLSPANVCQVPIPPGITG